MEHALTEARYTVKDLEQVLGEHPNTYDSRGNGQIEAVVKQVTGMLRTNKLDLEKRLGKKIPLQSPVLPWLVVRRFHRQHPREGRRRDDCPPARSQVRLREKVGAVR